MPFLFSLPPPAADDLPGCDSPGDHGKKRMRVGQRDREKFPIAVRVPAFQFPEQVLPLVSDLPFSAGNARGGPPGPDLVPVEPVPAAASFLMNGTEICRECGSRVGTGLEAFQLGMVPVTEGPALQDCLRQQGLAPERDQPFPVQVSGMKRPESHWGSGKNKKRSHPAGDSLQ
jgi:hypothetical protein